MNIAEMGEYLIDYGNGNTKKVRVDYIFEAVDIAEQDISNMDKSYTKKDVCIYPIINNRIQMTTVAVLPWYEMEATKDDIADGEVSFNYFKAGHYGAWMY